MVLSLTSRANLCRADSTRISSAFLRQEARAGLVARLAFEGIPPLANHGGAALVAKLANRSYRLSRHHLLLGPQAQEETQQSGRSRSGAAPYFREARHLSR